MERKIDVTTARGDPDFRLSSWNPAPRFREDKFCEDKFRGNDTFSFTHCSQITELF